MLLVLADALREHGALLSVALFELIVEKSPLLYVFIKQALHHFPVGGLLRYPPRRGLEQADLLGDVVAVENRKPGLRAHLVRTVRWRYVLICVGDAALCSDARAVEAGVARIIAAVEGPIRPFLLAGVDMVAFLPDLRQEHSLVRVEELLVVFQLSELYVGHFFFVEPVHQFAEAGFCCVCLWLRVQRESVHNLLAPRIMKPILLRVELDLGFECLLDADQIVLPLQLDLEAPPLVAVYIF